VDNFLTKLLVKAWGVTQARFDLKLHADGKTFVALGLASSSELPQPPIQPVENSLHYLSSGLFEKNGSTGGERPDRARNYSDLREFIEGISAEIPGGKLPTGQAKEQLIPFGTSNIKAELFALIDSLADNPFEQAEIAVKTKLAENLAEWHNAHGPDADPITDPDLVDSFKASEHLFIIHLKVLLEAVREAYGIQGKSPLQNEI
jgi:hypothetical protein